MNYLQTPNGHSIQLNVPGDEIFSAGGSNDVFAALNNLVADFASGTAQTQPWPTLKHWGRRSTLSLSSGWSSIARFRASAAASDSVTSEETQLTAAQTNLMQADVAQVSTQLSLSESQQTALEDVIAQLGAASNSLFSKM